ncbi:isoprenylcysteine carboxylmethyltransferase family protein [soil metagenome]
MAPRDTLADHPAVVLPPPLLYAAAFGIALVLHWLWPIPILGDPVAGWIGWVLVVAGLMLNIWGAWSMHSARTPINPYRPVRSIIESGAFHLSRNPLYVGLYFIFAGLTLLIDSLWGLLMLLPLLVVIHVGVIRPEERYLAEKFGDAYRAYCARVRRYL